LFKVGDSGPSDLQTRITPRWYATVRVTDPHLPYAQARDESNTPVDSDQLSVIPAQPSERAIQARRVEAPDLHSGFRQRSPEARRGLAERPHPVIQQPDAHPLTRLARQGVAETPTGVIVVNDVALEMDRSPRSVDDFKPDWIVFLRVLQ
jgi:hypothetical protein